MQIRGLVLLSMAACSGQMMMNPPADAGTDAGTPMPAMITASGALTGMISAPAPTVGYDAVADTGDFILSKKTSGLPFKVDVAVDFAGAPAAKTYDADGGTAFKCNVTVTSGTAASDTWVALRNSTAGADTGRCTLTLTNVTMGGAGYAATGSFDVLATPMGGASSGMVTLSGTFSP